MASAREVRSAGLGFETCLGALFFFLFPDPTDIWAQEDVLTCHTGKYEIRTQHVESGLLFQPQGPY